ncbi:hypothetical protein [Rhizobium sp. CIAT894]|uniref:hypothetical protein n=1 Tax=Rhizobium sp. CIAT894 TaxID=2020312 RepID=UPI000F739A70|nr:hypothetical protein [Rhizobium sp. CIAT894]
MALFVVVFRQQLLEEMTIKVERISHVAWPDDRHAGILTRDCRALVFDLRRLRPPEGFPSLSAARIGKAT